MVRRIPHWPGPAAALLALALPAAAAAQENSVTTNAIGSPLLRDFQLEGTRTTPPAEPAEAPATPPPSAEQPAERPRPTTSAPAERAPAPADRSEARSAPAAQAPTIRDFLSEAQPAAPIEIPTSTDVAPEAAAPVAAEPEPTLQPQPVPESALTGGAMWGALALALLGLLGLVWYRSRRTATAGEAPALARAAMPESETPPAPRPIPPAPAEEELRPWIELEFKPERLVTTPTEATVHFALLVRNKGKSVARNIRIETRMFNANPNQKRDIAAFFATPIAAEGQGPAIPPQGVASVKGTVVMPRNQMRAVEVQGRPLFIPTVAVNLVYEWAEARKGQTSASYVVGIEKEASAEKMGAFRLDLGPRIYRQVGGRPLELARAV